MRIHLVVLGASLALGATALIAHAGTDCFALGKDARAALAARNLEDSAVLDDATGLRLRTTAQGLGELRTGLEILHAVCARPEYANAGTECDGRVYFGSPITRATYDAGDLCSLSADVDGTLQKIGRRALDHLFDLQKPHEPTTVAYFRDRLEGWLTNPHPTTFAETIEVDAALKAERTAQATAIYQAAGLPLPDDLSFLWGRHQAHAVELRANIEATVDHWKPHPKPCKGSGCKVAQASLKKYQKDAKVKKVFARDWQVELDWARKPVKRVQDIYILYQVPGDPYCQYRQFTVTEHAVGRTKFKPASGAPWGYVRFQRCG
jgi:hypothetical protein